MGSDRAGSDGIWRVGYFGKRPGLAWHGSGYRWKSGNRALILPMLLLEHLHAQTPGPFSPCHILGVDSKMFNP